MTVIDIHTHMLTPPWLELIRGATSSRYHVVTDPDDPEVHRIFVRGVPYSFHTPRPSYFDWELRMEKMDEAGVDVAVVSLTCPQANFGGPDTAAKAARVSNDDMIAAQKRWPDRIRFLAAIPWLYPQQAIEELEYALDNGAVGVLVCGSIDGDSPVDERFAPIWKAIDDAELPVLVHPTAMPGVEVAARNGLSNAIGFHFDTTHCLERMINTGFLDRYPNVKIIGSHAGGFLPFIMGRLDYKRDSDRKPSNYKGRIWADSIAFSDGAMDLTIEVFGRDNVLFGSDYPYGSTERMKTFKGMLDRVDDETRQRILSRNTEAIFTRL